MGKRYPGPCAVCGTKFLWPSPSPLCAKCKRAKEKQRERRTNAVGQRKRNALIGKRGNKCQMCGATGTLHAHHILPVSKGGSDDDDNLLLVCVACHKKIHGVAR